MRIIIITDESPPKCTGGAGISTFIQAEYIKNLGNEVLLISGTDNINDDQKKVIYKGINIVYIYSYYPHKLRTYFQLYNPRAIKILKKIFIEFKPDIIHAHNIINKFSFYSIVIAKKNAKAVFFTARDVMSFAYSKYWWFINKNDNRVQKTFDYKIRQIDLLKQAKKAYFPFRNYIIRRCVNNCNAIFSVSNELKKVLEINGFKHVITVHNTILVEDFDNIQTDEIIKFKKLKKIENKKIIFVNGRLSGLKGGELILKAISIIKIKIPEIVLVLAMDKQHFKSLENTIRKLKIEKNILYLGWLTTDEIKLVYKSSDVCVVPSVCFDAFPRVNLEAMAARKPLVITCFGGSPEAIINGVTGLIINPYNIKMMADNIMELLLKPELSYQYGNAGYLLAKEKFNNQIQIDKIIREYRKYI